MPRRTKVRKSQQRKRGIPKLDLRRMKPGALRLAIRRIDRLIESLKD